MQKRTFLALMAALAASACAGTFPVASNGRVRVKENSGAIRRAVLEAAKERKFTVEENSRSRITVIYPDPGHSKFSRYHARYELRFGDGWYDLRYLSSSGLAARNCDTGTSGICGHRKLEVWRSDFDSAILSRLTRAA